jgi:tetratricopeptide (TPR) repeat protein
MQIACAERRDDDCAARVKDILTQDPNNFEAVFQDGLLSLAKGDAARAIRNFEYLSNAFRRNPQVRLQLALAHLLSAKDATEVTSRKAIDAAEGRLNEAIKLDPHLEPAVLLFAELKIRKGSSAAAIDPLARLIKERPQVARAHHQLATAYLAQRQNDQALAVYRKMTELFPEDAQPHFLIGTIRLAQRQSSEARQAFEKSIAISPDYLPPVEMLVDLDIAEGQYATSMDRVQKLIDKEPNRAQLWALRAKLYLAQKDFTRAEADFLKAIELDANLTPVYLLLAQLYVSSNRQQQAIEKLNATIEKNKSVPALILLASIHERAKNFAAARDAYETLLTVSTNNALAHNNLAVIYSEHLGQIDKAHDLAKRARELNPNEPHMADTLGWILFKRGDYRNALRLLQESSSKLPDNPEIQLHLGMAHYMLGEEDASRIALQKAVDASADFRGKEDARQRLALLAISVPTADAGARAELERQLRQRPNDPAALSRLAEIQRREGSLDQAVKTYEKVVTDNPQFAPAIRQLALLYGQRTADVSKAYEIALKARQSYPDDPDIAKSLGILSYRRELYPRAVELLKEAIAMRKEDPELLYYLGAAHSQLKQWSECKGILERALALKISPELAKEAKPVLAICSEALPQ